MTRSGEVAVKRDGHVHAVEAPELSGPISVDVDAEHVTLPPETHVSFQDPDQDAVDDAADEAETDGGVTPTRSEVELRGSLGMSKEQSGWAVLMTSVALLVAGYLHGTGDSFAAILIVIAAGFLGWFSLNSLVRWREVEQR